MRLIDADATIKYLREFRCKDCDRRKGMKNGKVRFCYEIGEAPCHACDIGDTIDYFLDEVISPTIDSVPVVRCKDCAKWDKSTMEHYEDVISGSGDTAECRMFCDMDSWGEFADDMRRTDGDWFCADGEIRNSMGS